MKRMKFSAMVGVAALLLYAVAADAASYGYSSQRISDFDIVTVSGDVEFNTAESVADTSAESDTQSPSSDSDNAPLDPLQAFVGSNPPEENFNFGADGDASNSAKGQVDADYARSDALITDFDDSVIGANGESVAESLMASPGGESTGTTTWALGANITVNTAATLSFEFDYMNSLYAELDEGDLPGSISTAGVSLDITVTDSDGNVVFESSPDEVNESRSRTTPGSLEHEDSGTVVTATETGLLTAGEYDISIIGGSSTDQVVAVPSPAALPAGLVLMGGALVRRRSCRS